MSEVDLERSSERQLLDGLRAGDEKAYRALLDDYSPMVLQTALRYIPTNDPVDAYDVVQQVFVNLFRRIEAIPSSDEFSLRMYLHRVTRSVCIDHIRAQYGKRGVREVPLAAAENLPDLSTDPIASIDANRLVQKALASISERDREIVQMRLNDLSFGEIARLTGVSEQSVRRRYLHAITSFRQLFEHARAEADE